MEASGALTPSAVSRSSAAWACVGIDHGAGTLTRQPSTGQSRPGRSAPTSASILPVDLTVPLTVPSAAGGRSDLRHLDSHPPATNLTSNNGIRAPLTRTPSSSANLVMSDYLSPRLARRIGRPRVRSPDQPSLLLSRSLTQVLRSNMVSAREHVAPIQGEIIEPSNGPRLHW
jgi:hypothetical protein